MLCAADIAAVFVGGVTGCGFSLDPPEKQLFAQFFQRATVEPACLMTAVGYRGVFLTMCHTDYMLKCLLNGVEVSVQPPFRQRPASGASGGFMNRLSPALRAALASVHDRTAASGVATPVVACRTWIEVQTPQVAQALSAPPGGVQEFALSPPLLVVKHTSFRKRTPEDGALPAANDTDWLQRGTGLVDCTAEADVFDPFRDLVAALNDNMAELCTYFPEFQRLAELSNVMVSCNVLQILCGKLLEAGHVGAAAVDAIKRANPTFDLSAVGAAAAATSSVTLTTHVSMCERAVCPPGVCDVVPSVFAAVIVPDSIPVGPGFAPGVVVDYIDDNFVAYNCRVVRLLPNGLLRLHWNGWRDEWDFNASPNCARLHPAFTFTPAGKLSDGKATGVVVPPAVGDVVLALAPTGSFLPAAVTAYDAATLLATVQFQDPAVADRELKVGDGAIRQCAVLTPATAADIEAGSLLEGQDLEAVSDTFVAFTASVVAVAPGAVQVHFHGCDSKDDRWILQDEWPTRLFPLGTHIATALLMRSERVGGAGTGGPTSYINVAVVEPPVGTPVAVSVTRDGVAARELCNVLAAGGGAVSIQVPGCAAPIEVPLTESVVQRRSEGLLALTAAEWAGAVWPTNRDVDLQDEHLGWFTATVRADNGGRVVPRLVWHVHGSAGQSVPTLAAAAHAHACWFAL